MDEVIKEIVVNQWSIVAWLVTVVISLFALKYSMAAKDVAKQANQISNDANQLNIDSLLLARYNEIIMRKIQNASELADDKVFMIELRNDARALVDKLFTLDEQYEKSLGSFSESGCENIDELIESKIMRTDETDEAIINWQDSLDKFDKAITALEVQLSEMSIMKRYSATILREFDMELLETEADEVDFARERVKGMSKSIRLSVDKGRENVAQVEAMIARREKLLDEHIVQQKEQQGFDNAWSMMAKRR
jgi:hypothetical protein